jgi:ribosomal protein S17
MYLIIKKNVCKKREKWDNIKQIRKKALNSEKILPKSPCDECELNDRFTGTECRSLTYIEISAFYVVELLSRTSRL